MSTTSLRPQASRVSIASRVVPGHVRHDRPLLAEQRVEQARLADVRPARRTRSRPARRPSRRPSRRPIGGLGDRRRRGRAPRRHRRPRRRRASGSPTTNGSSRPAAISSAQASASASRALRASSRLALGRQRPDDRVEQVARAAAVRGGDRVGLLPAERVELGAFELALLVVGLVDDDDDRAPWRGAGSRAASRSAGVVPVDGVDHEQDDVRLGDGQPRLLLDARLDRVVRVELEAAGVDDDEAPAVPLGVAVEAVARRPGAVLDDRRCAGRGTG